MIDFDGTLAERPGMWSKTLLDVLDDQLPGHGMTRDEVRPYLRGGFPWHRPDEPHMHLSVADSWWQHVGQLFIPVFIAAGADRRTAQRLVEMVRMRYCDVSGYRLFPDTRDALDALRAGGCRVVILSNHVPELTHIVRGLGLDAMLDDVISSAVLGYEKPHPQAFYAALGGAHPADAWMIGDNAVVDVDGARAIGMNAIQVRGASGGPTVQHAVRTILSARCATRS